MLDDGGYPVFSRLLLLLLFATVTVIVTVTITVPIPTMFNGSSMFTTITMTITMNGTCSSPQISLSNIPLSSILKRFECLQSNSPSALAEEREKQRINDNRYYNSTGE